LEYLSLLGIPVFAFGISLWLLITQISSFFGFLFLFLSSLWLQKVIRYLYYKSYKITVSEKVLFETIDDLFDYHDWEYGDIKDNEITIYPPQSPEFGKKIFYIKFFKDEIWVTNIFIHTTIHLCCNLRSLF
jgi:hypothetical protein